jgi:hypothetical protein
MPTPLTPVVPELTFALRWPLTSTQLDEPFASQTINDGSLFGDLVSTPAEPAFPTNSVEFRPPISWRDAPIPLLSIIRMCSLLVVLPVKRTIATHVLGWETLNVLDVSRCAPEFRNSMAALLLN